MTTYTEHAHDGGSRIKAWVDGVPVEYAAWQQLRNIAALPFIHSHVAVMPDVHFGRGATVGSVIPTIGAIVPAAVGVDIGCGMMAVQTTLTSQRLPESLRQLRGAIERDVPVGFSDHRGAVPKLPEVAWTRRLKQRYEDLQAKHPGIAVRRSPAEQLGTLGGGNHFIEVCLDEADRVWVMLHSGSRGAGNRIGGYFIDRAKEEIASRGITLPDRDLAWLDDGTDLFADYTSALDWAQIYARMNREVMMGAVLAVMRRQFTDFGVTDVAVNCHHNYVAREQHFGANVWLTRKGAVSARAGELGIIPGSMGARSYIVRGKGNPDSFHSCSHGAGRAMSRGEAKRRFTVDDHAHATAGVECRKDQGVVDETPMAYKDIDAVMAAQSDLVDVVHTLKQVLCVKG